MAPMNKQNYENQFFSWFSTFLKDKGLDFSRSGVKTNVGPGNRHDFDLITGYWKDPNYSVNIAPRWIYHIIPGPTGLHAENPARGPLTLGVANTAQEDKAGVVFRLVPLVRQDPGDFAQDDDFEIHALFVFHGATPHGSSAQAFDFDPATGAMHFKKEPLEYIGCGLLGLMPRGTELKIIKNGVEHTITYGDIVDALATGIRCAPAGQVAAPMPTYDLTTQTDHDRLKKMVENAWMTAGPVASKNVATAVVEDHDNDDDDEIIPPASLEIPEDTSLLGIDPSVYRQINAALKSGKQHIMLYGPPGTGKTTLARWIATTLTGGKWTLVTGSSDWSSQDIIGGYQPVGNGGVAFIPGVLLRRFDRPLIIDELNRCDIDKVIGPLFTVLSGQQTTLPYRLDIEDTDSPQYVILPDSKPLARPYEFAPGPHWRLIATINSIDKAALYQMSYALSRRFGWVYVDTPHDMVGFIKSYLGKTDSSWVEPATEAPCPLGKFWEAINKMRALGPASIIDVIKAVRAMDDEANFFAEPTLSMQDALLNAVDMVLLPMLDGVTVQEADSLAKTAIEEFGLNTDFERRIRTRMNTIAV